MKTVKLPSGDIVPALGQGTWFMGEGRKPHEEEVDALRYGIECGLTVIDTAEMYGNGGAEKVVGDAIADKRETVFIVDKVLPSNASLKNMRQACERSLRHLKSDYIDVYLLHWRGSHPLAETVEAFEELREEGKIRSWGVSNFDTADMDELLSVTPAETITTNQVLYNLSRRGIEFDLMPWCEQHNIPIMAYSPIEQGRILKYPQLQEVGDRHNATPAMVALAWVMQHNNVVTIPKSTTPLHIQDNRQAADMKLTEDDLALLDVVFPAPLYKKRLEML